jgi:hypothetical protein
MVAPANPATSNSGPTTRSTGVDPTSSSDPPGERSGAAPAPPDARASQSSSESIEQPGDLLAPPQEIDALGNDPATYERIRNTPEERARRRTGAIAIAGIAALGATLVSHERGVVRRRLNT